MRLKKYLYFFMRWFENKLPVKGRNSHFISTKKFEKTIARLGWSWTWITLPPSLNGSSNLLFKSSNDSLQFSNTINLFLLRSATPSLSMAANLHLPVPDSSSNAYCRKQKSLGLLCSKFHLASLLFIYFSIYSHISYYLFSLVVFWDCTIEMMFSRSASIMLPLALVTSVFPDCILLWFNRKFEEFLWLVFCRCWKTKDLRYC